MICLHAGDYDIRNFFHFIWNEMAANAIDNGLGGFHEGCDTDSIHVSFVLEVIEPKFDELAYKE